MIPVTIINLAGKSPPLTPEQNDDPERNQQVREAQEAAAHHVAPQLLSPLDGEVPGRMPPAAVPVRPCPSYHAPRAGRDLVPDRGAGVVGGRRVDGRPVGPIRWPCHDVPTGQPLM